MCATGNAASDNNDEDPVHWWAWGLLCQVMQIGSCFHAEQLLGSIITLADLFYQLQAWRQGRLAVARNDFQQFYIGEGVTGSAEVGDCPWVFSPNLMIYGRHNGAIGMAVAIGIDASWNPTDDLQAGWTAEIIEQRDDAALVGLLQA
jgi:hypothetical protein